MTSVWLWRRSRRGAIAMTNALIDAGWRGQMFLGLSPKIRCKKHATALEDVVGRQVRWRRRLASRSEAELLAQVNPAHILVRNDFVRRTFHEHLAVVHDVGAIDDIQRFPHVMVGYQ